MSILDLSKREQQPEGDLASLEAGLDALETATRTERPRWARFWSQAWPPVLTVGVLLGLWAWAAEVDFLHKKDYQLPSPAAVWSSFSEQASSGLLWDSLQGSLFHGVLGFLAAIVIGTPLGLALGRVRPLRRGLGPIVSGLQSLPSVAWVPAAIIFLGINTEVLYAVVLLGAVPSIANGMVAGLDQVPPIYQRVGRVLGARGLVFARHVLVPAALPGYLAGLRQGWAFSWRSLMAAELVARTPKIGPGLAQLLDSGRENSDMALVVTAILMILVVGIAVELCLFAPVERRVLKRRGLGA